MMQPHRHTLEAGAVLIFNRDKTFGRSFVDKVATVNEGNYHTTDGALKAQAVNVQPIAVPSIPGGELKEITNNFSFDSLIGEGSYGRRVLAYEFASNGSLHNILHGRKGVKGAQPGPVLSWAQRVKIAVGAAKGLEYLHEKADPHIIHRDVKSSNVLIFDDDAAKIADFDLSNQATDKVARLHSTRVLGTFGYHAPDEGNYHTTDGALKAQAVNVQPIAVPSIPGDELKEITNNFSSDSLIGEGSYGRVSMMSRIKHENFVELLGYCVDGNQCVLAYEYASNGSLHNILHVGAVKGLEYLHEKVDPHIIHRDVKSSNVLIFDDDAAKIANFDLSNQATDKAARLHSTRVLGTFGYHAPE
ncbi:unnamed protein product [Fraxinus pennsylvanica]|uniref:Protein kinase domain-containing protein n=1 Tax=Fraxinus pennsylvanica TaxID=56036 RepID=A0AAD1ZIS9_9LAMI|nr:unnamed protein product [Fraxinus pennsylvanica]